MRVLKFGGTSLANPERFLQAAEIIEKAHLNDQAAGVLSAPAKITNHLVAIVDKAQSGEDYTAHLEEAKAIFQTLITSLHAANPKFDLNGVSAFIQTELDDICAIAQRAAESKSCPDIFRPACNRDGSISVRSDSPDLLQGTHSYLAP